MSEFMDEMMADPMYAAWNDDYTEPEYIDYDPDYYSLRDDFTE
jgi:hypothetical protein